MGKQKKFDDLTDVYQRLKTEYNQRKESGKAIVPEDDLTDIAGGQQQDSLIPDLTNKKFQEPVSKLQQLKQTNVVDNLKDRELTDIDFDELGSTSEERKQNWDKLVQSKQQSKPDGQVIKENVIGGDQSLLQALKKREEFEKNRILPNIDAFTSPQEKQLPERRSIVEGFEGPQIAPVSEAAYQNMPAFKRQVDKDRQQIENSIKLRESVNQQLQKTEPLTGLPYFQLIEVDAKERKKENPYLMTPEEADQFYNENWDFSKSMLASTREALNNIPIARELANTLLYHVNPEDYQFVVANEIREKKGEDYYASYLNNFAGSLAGLFAVGGKVHEGINTLKSIIELAKTSPKIASALSAFVAGTSYEGLNQTLQQQGNIQDPASFTANALASGITWTAFNLAGTKDWLKLQKAITPTVVPKGTQLKGFVPKFNTVLKGQDVTVGYVKENGYLAKSIANWLIDTGIVTGVSNISHRVANAVNESEKKDISLVDALQKQFTEVDLGELGIEFALNSIFIGSMPRRYGNFVPPRISPDMETGQPKLLPGRDIPPQGARPTNVPPDVTQPKVRPTERGEVKPEIPKPKLEADSKMEPSELEATSNFQKEGEDKGIIPPKSPEIPPVSESVSLTPELTPLQSEVSEHPIFTTTFNFDTKKLNLKEDIGEGEAALIITKDGKAYYSGTTHADIINSAKINPDDVIFSGFTKNLGEISGSAFDTFKKKGLPKNIEQIAKPEIPKEPVKKDVKVEVEKPKSEGKVEPVKSAIQEIYNNYADKINQALDKGDIAKGDKGYISKTKNGADLLREIKSKIDVAPMVIETKLYQEAINKIAEQGSKTEKKIISEDYGNQPKPQTKVEKQPYEIGKKEVKKESGHESGQIGTPNVRIQDKAPYEITKGQYEGSVFESRSSEKIPQNEKPILAMRVDNKVFTDPKARIHSDIKIPEEVYGGRRYLPIETGWLVNGEFKIQNASQHKALVEQALKEGKKVPDEVLKDYPDLVKPEAKFEVGEKVIFTNRDGKKYEVNFRGYDGEKNAVIVGKPSDRIDQMTVEVSQLSKKTVKPDLEKPSEEIKPEVEGKGKKNIPSPLSDKSDVSISKESDAFIKENFYDNRVEYTRPDKPTEKISAPKQNAEISEYFDEAGKLMDTHAGDTNATIFRNSWNPSVKDSYNHADTRLNTPTADIRRAFEFQRIKKEQGIEPAREYVKTLKDMYTTASKQPNEAQVYTDNNKASALRMLGEGKKDTQIVKALGLSGKAGMDKVRQWRKEFEAEGKISEDIKEVYKEQFRSKEFNNALFGESIGGTAGKDASGVNFYIDKNNRLVFGNLQEFPLDIQDKISSGELKSGIVRIVFGTQNTRWDTIIDAQLADSNADEKTKSIISDAVKGIITKQPPKKQKPVKPTRKPESLEEAVLSYLVKGGTIKPTQAYPRSSLLAMGINPFKISKKGMNPEKIFETVAPDLWDAKYGTRVELPAQSEMFEELLYKYDTHAKRKEYLEKLTGEKPETMPETEDMQAYERLDEIVLNEYINTDGELDVSRIQSEIKDIANRADVDEAFIQDYLDSKEAMADFPEQEFFDPFADIEQAIEKKGINQNEADRFIEAGIEQANADEPIIKDIERKAEIAENLSNEEINESIREADQVIQPSDINKAVSASSRFRPKEFIGFEPALVGPSGAKLTGYEWKYEWEDLGDDKARRISDWTQSEISDDTGRQIVHQYYVTLPDGKQKIVSSESVLELLGYTEKSASQNLPSLISASKTLAKNQMQLAALQEESKRWKEAINEARELPKPAIQREVKHYKDGDVTEWTMGDNYVLQHNTKPIEDERKQALERGWEELRAQEISGISRFSDTSRYNNIRDLENRIARQQKKINDILKKSADLSPREQRGKPSEQKKDKLAELKEQLKDYEERKKLFAPDKGLGIDNTANYDRLIKDVKNEIAELEGQAEPEAKELSSDTQKAIDLLKEALQTDSAKESQRFIKLLSDYGDIIHTKINNIDELNPIIDYLKSLPEESRKYLSMAEGGKTPYNAYRDVVLAKEYFERHPEKQTLTDKATAELLNKISKPTPWDTNDMELYGRKALVELQNKGYLRIDENSAYLTDKGKDFVREKLFGITKEEALKTARALRDKVMEKWNNLKKGDQAEFSQYGTGGIGTVIKINKNKDGEVTSINIQVQGESGTRKIDKKEYLPYGQIPKQLAGGKYSGVDTLHDLLHTIRTFSVQKPYEQMQVVDLYNDLYGKSSEPEQSQKEEVSKKETEGLWSNYKKFRKKAIETEPATAKELQDMYYAVLENKEAFEQQIIEESINNNPKHKNRRQNTKEKIASDTYDQVLERLVNLASDSYSISMGMGNFKEAKLKAQKEVIDNATDEKIKELFDKRKARQDELIRAIKHPITLHDYRTAEMYRELTPEEQDRFEDLQAIQKRERYDQKALPQLEKVDIGNLEVIKDIDTRDNSDLWVIKIKDRVPPSQFAEIRDNMKKLGGYWSRFKGGFIFKEDPTSKLSGEAEVKPLEKDTGTLRDVAERQIEKAEEDLSKERLTNTARRARMAEGAEADAEKRLSIGRTMLNIADGIDGGDIVLLKDIKSRTQVEELESIAVRSKYERGRQENLSYEQYKNKPVDNEDIRYAELPTITIGKSLALKFIDQYPTSRTAKELSKRANEDEQYIKSIKNPNKKAYAEAYNKWIKEGKKQGYEPIVRKGLGAMAQQAVRQRLNELHSADKDNIDITDLVDDFLKRAENNPDIYTDRIKDDLQAFNRLKRMGIEDDKDLRAALREYLTVRDGGNQNTEAKKIKKLERELIGTKIPGYFPTPKDIVADMLADAKIEEGMTVLEPSAGKGNIADMIKESGHKVDTIEWNSTLSDILKAKGHNVVGNNFLEHKENYDRIVMNPPFENAQDIDHVRYAYDLLNPEGRVVALMSGSTLGRQDNKTQDFRKWVSDNGGRFEMLPEGSFKTSERPTGVSVVKVVIDKPKASFSVKSPNYENRIKRLQDQIDTEQQAMFVDEGKIAQLENEIKKIKQQQAQEEAVLGLEADVVKKDKLTIPKGFDIENTSLADLRNYSAQLEAAKNLSEENQKLLEKINNRIYALENRGEQGTLFEPDQGSLFKAKSEKPSAVRTGEEQKHFERLENAISDHPSLSKYNVINVKDDYIIATKEQWLRNGHDPVKRNFRKLKEGDEGYEQGKEKYRAIGAGKLDPKGEGGNIEVSRTEGVDTLTHEAIHAIEREITKEVPELAIKILEFKKDVRDIYASENVNVPLDAEIFVESYMKFAGWDNNYYDVIPDLPPSILKEVNEFIARSKSGKDNLPNFMAMSYKPQAAQQPKDYSLTGATFEGGKLQLLSAKHPEFSKPFFSKMEQVLTNKLPNKFSAKMLNDIIRSGEIKEAEIKWSGIEDFLRDKIGTGEKIDKQELMDFLRANELEVKEVVKGSPKMVKELDEARKRLDKAKNDATNKLDNHYKNSNYAYWDSQIYNIQRGNLEVVDKGVEKVLGKRLMDELRESYAKLMGFEDKNAWDNKTKFTQWTLPGGENYREMLFTMPEIIKGGERPTLSPEARDKIALIIGEDSGIKKPAWAYNSLLDNIEMAKTPNERTNAISNLDLSEANARKVSELVSIDLKGNYYREASFKSSHWEEPNVMAHARLNDRFIAEPINKVSETDFKVAKKNLDDYRNNLITKYGKDEWQDKATTFELNKFKELSTKEKQAGVGSGTTQKKILFIEEVQSDWALEGRKKGYRSDPEVEKRIELKKQEFDKWKVSNGFPEAKTPTEVGIRYGTQLSPRQSTELNEFVRSIEKPFTGSVPDFPFKNNWHEFVFKSLLRRATEGGYDGISWVTGEITADRYDLSKHIDAVRWSSDEDSKFISFEGLKGVSDQTLEIYVKTETGIIKSADLGAPNDWKGKHLSDVVGKDIAEKILKDKDGRLAGEGLKIGGTWATNLYDKTIPNFLNKYGKKWGAKVESTEIVRFPGLVEHNPDAAYTKVHYLPITEQMKQSVLFEGQPMFLAKPIQTDTPEFKRWFGKSKVVDDKGEPLVVYHGTPKAGFSEFVSKKFNNVAGYFTVDTALANLSAVPTLSSEIPSANIGVYPVYLSLQNPVDLTSLDGSKNYSIDEFTKALPFAVSQSIKDNFIDNIKARGYRDTMPVWSYLSGDTFRALIKAKGYDGIIYNELNPKTYNKSLEGTPYLEEPLKDGKSYIAFNSTQIKSATGNKGTFDPNNPDIRFSARAEGVEQPITNKTIDQTEEFTFGIGLGQAIPEVGKAIKDVANSSTVQAMADSDFVHEGKRLFNQFVSPPPVEAELNPDFAPIYRNAEKKLTRDYVENQNEVLKGTMNNFKDFRKLNSADKTALLSVLNDYHTRLYKLTFQATKIGKSTKNIDEIIDHYKPNKEVEKVLRQLDALGKGSLEMVKQGEKEMLVEFKKKVSDIFSSDEFITLFPEFKAGWKYVDNKAEVIDAIWNNDPGKRAKIADFLVEKKYSEMGNDFYVNLSRPLEAGHYLVHLERPIDPNIEDSQIERRFTYFESKSEADKFVSEMEADRWVLKSRVARVGKLLKNQSDWQGIDQSTLLHLFNTSNIEIPKEVLNELLKTVKEGYWEKHTIRRNYTPGLKWTSEELEQNVVNLLAESSSKKNKTFGIAKMDKQLIDLEERYGKMVRDPKADEKELRKLEKTLDYSQRFAAGLKISNNRALDGIRGMMYLWDLGFFRPSFMLQQTVENLQTVMNVAIAQAGVLKGEKHFIASGGETMNALISLLNEKLGKPITVKDKKMWDVLTRLRNMEKVAPLGVKVLFGESGDPKIHYKPIGKGMDAVKNILGAGGQAIEYITRIQTAITFYRIATQEKGMTDVNEITQYVADMIDLGKANYSKTGTIVALNPRSQRGFNEKTLGRALTQTFLVYKKWASANTGLYRYLWNRSKVGFLIKALVGLGAHGIRKFPIIAGLYGIASFLLGLMDEEPDKELQEIENKLNETVGGKLGSVLNRGVGTYFGTDLSGLMQEGSALPSDVLGEKISRAKSMQDLIYQSPSTIMESVVGRPFSFVKDLASSAVAATELMTQDLTDKERITREKRTLRSLPSTIRSLIQPDILAEEGYRVGGKQAIRPDELDPTDLAISRMGFRPEKFSKQSEMVNATSSMVRKTTSEVIELIKKGENSRAKKLYNDLFIKIRDEIDPFTIKQKERILHTEAFISQYVLPRLSGKEKEIIKEWKDDYIDKKSNPRNLNRNLNRNLDRNIRR